MGADTDDIMKRIAERNKESAASPTEDQTASSAITTSEGQSPTGTVPTEHGGIDLSQIELTLKDEKFVSSLNPADLKVLRAAKALKDEWDSLSLLYVHEIMLLLKDNLVKDLQNKVKQGLFRTFVLKHSS